MRKIHSTQQRTSRLLPLIAGLMLGGLATSAMATDGYFSAGYGMKSLGMGGAAMAATDNAFAGANNPATAAWAGNRVEAGISWFSPNRSVQRSGDTTSTHDATATSDNTSFWIPEFGYNREIDNKMSIGLSVYGNGGMNTSYANSSVTCNNNGQSYPANVLCGTTALGVNLTQLIIAPTFAIKLNENSSIGISPLIVRQTFSASGLQAFDTSNNSTSTNPGHVTDNGNSDSNGFGLRLGYLIKLNETVSFGASYAPKITMSKFSGYSGLFANSGEFDIPENYALGFSFNTSPTSQWLIDYQRINYGNVAATGNPSGPPPFNLGAANGAGFGWNNIDILKIGYQWQPNENLALRVGYNHSQNPITSSNVTFNILAPGVITNHYTVGGTFAIDKDHEVSFAYMYAPYNSVSGSSMMNTLGQTSNATDTIRMSEQSLGIQFGWKF